MRYSTPKTPALFWSRLIAARPLSPAMAPGRFPGHLGGLWRDPMRGPGRAVDPPSVGGRHRSRGDGRRVRPCRRPGDRMLRLMGLPATSRCPDVTVQRRADGLELRFSGPGAEEVIDVDAR